MKKIFLLIYCTLTFFSCYGSSIVFIDGLASAGKTSICKQFIDQNPDWVWINQDQIYICSFISFIKEEHPYEYELIAQAIDTENIFHAIQRKQVLFRNDVSDVQKIGALQAIDKLYTIVNHNKWLEPFNLEVKTYTLELIESMIADEKNMIIDSWFLTNHYDIGYFEQYNKTFVVLAYCPLPVLIDRTTKRGLKALEENCLLEMRSYKQALISFCRYFTFSKQQHGSIDILTKKDLEEVFSEVERHINYLPFLNYKNDVWEISLQQLLLLKMQMSQTIKDGNCYIVPPDLNYDLVITTNKESSEHFASVIKKMIQDNELHEPILIDC